MSAQMADPAPAIRRSGLASKLRAHLDDLPLYLAIISVSAMMGLAVASLRVGADALYLERFGGDDVAWLLVGVSTGSAVFGLFMLWQGARGRTETFILRAIVLLLAALVSMVLLTEIIPWSGFVYALIVVARIAGTSVTVIFYMFLSILLDAREGKRTAGTISATILAATTAGAVGAPQFARFTDVISIILVGVIAMAAGMALIGFIAARWRARFAVERKSTSQTREPDRGSLMREVRRTPYVRLTLIKIAVIALFTTVLEFLFLTTVSETFAEAQAQAAFLGYFFAAATLSAMVSSLFLAPILLNNFGIGVGLQVQPVFILLVLIPGSLLGPAGILPILLTGGVILAHWGNRVFGESISRPFERVLNMPLEADIRVRIQALQNSVVRPLFALVGSLSIVGLTAITTDSQQLILLALCILVIATILTMRAIAREYSATLETALQRHKTLRPVGDPIYDKASRDILLSAIRSGAEFDSLYALSQLPLSELGRHPDILDSLLDHPAKAVRLKALEAIEELGNPALSTAVSRLLAEELDDDVRGQAVRTWISLSENDDADDMVSLSHTTSPSARKHVAIGLLRHGGINGIIEAGTLVTQLAQSSEARDRHLAAEIIGGAGMAQLQRPLRRILEDADPANVRAAIRAAGDIGSERLVPKIISLLASSQFHGEARAALLKLDDVTFAALVAAFEAGEKSLAETARIIWCLGQISDPRGLQYLANRLDYPDLPVRRVLVQVVANQADSISAAARTRAERALDDEAATIAWLARMRLDLASALSTAFVDAALLSEIQAARRTIVDLVSLLHGREAVDGIRRGLFGQDVARRALSIERLVTLLPRMQRTPVIAAIERDDPAQLVDALAIVVQTSPEPAEARLSEIISYPKGLIFPWTKATALLVAGDAALRSLWIETDLATEDDAPIVRETALWALARMAGRDPDWAAGLRARSEQLAFDDNIFVSRLALSLPLPDHKPDTDYTLTGVQPQWRAPMPLLVEKVLLLRRTPYFAAVGENELARICDQMEEIDIGADITVFRPGDELDGLYVVAAGGIRLLHKSHQPRALGKGAVLGLAHLFNETPIGFHAVTTERSLVLHLSEGDLLDLIADNVAISRGLIRGLTLMARG
ncbi:MAG: cyclic nucleotide-binding domain-containing protein [Pseudomonadota bacterium]